MEKLTKICTKCNCEKDLTEFYKDSKPKGNKDGYRATCKKCMKQYADDNKDSIKNRKKNKYEENKDLVISKQKEYYYKNREVSLSRMKKYRETNKDYFYNYNKQYREDNKESISEQHKKYYKTEAGRAVSKNSDYNRRIHKKKGNVSSSYILDLQKNAKKCYWCECDLKNKIIHIDHYFPLSKGGTHTVDNLVASCSKCNLQKGSKTPFEFANRIGKLL